MAEGMLQRGCAAIARGLRDFGYKDVNATQIEAYHKRWKAGESFPGNVIALFAERDFKSRPDIFGTPDVKE